MDTTGTQRIAALEKLVAEHEGRIEACTAQLKEARSELESLDYAISHDLRAPLRNIYGFAHLLGKKYRDRLEGQGLEYLEMIIAGVERMGRMIDGLLTLSRIGRAEIKEETVDLSAMAAAILTQLQENRPGRTCRITIAPGITARGDRYLLQIVLQHLLENAWKFTDGTDLAEIEFGTGRQENRTVYFVRDNGAGFAMDQRYRLFSPFQRLHLESEFPGLGVGLAVVKKAVQRLGGQVFAEGAEETGATFSFTLGNASASLSAQDVP